MFKKVIKGQYIEIVCEGIVIHRTYIRKEPYFGLSDEARVDILVDMYNENPERVLRGIIDK